MSELILAFHHARFHDSGAATFVDYDLKAAIQQERLSRVKGDGGYPDLAIDEALSIAGATRRDVDCLVLSRSDFPVEYFTHFRGVRWLREKYRTHVKGAATRNIAREGLRAKTVRPHEFFDIKAFLRDGGFREETKVYFHNHHSAHALPTLFYTDWSDALLVTADGGGDTVAYSHRHFHDGKFESIYGTDEWLKVSPAIDSMGHAYGAFTRALGFRQNRHEGKLTGLSALGQPVVVDEVLAHFRVDENGRVFSDFHNNEALYRRMVEIAGKVSREDAAASIQEALERTMLTSVSRLLEKHPSRNLGLAGGIFANVRLNRRLADNLPLDEIFVFPGMGDEGMPVGGTLAYLLERDGIAHWLKQRRRLKDVYLGRDYTATADGVLSATPGVRKTAEQPVSGAAVRLTAGQLGAIYTGRMEFGPRALGARTILANPSRRDTHDLLNERLDRSEFMPFAPVVVVDRAEEVFDVTDVNRYACRFMTITCDVRPEWRERIAAVVHVDHSARPQIIERDTNPLYYDIIRGFEAQTGTPVLVNTSFNVHEEPIVDAPQQCVKALLDGRIDFVVTQNALYDKAPH